MSAKLKGFSPLIVQTRRRSHSSASGYGFRRRWFHVDLLPSHPEHGDQSKMDPADDGIVTAVRQPPRARCAVIHVPRPGVAKRSKQPGCRLEER